MRHLIIKLGTSEEGVSSSGYDERGLLGLAFHPQFYQNGLFYLHYSVAGTQHQVHFLNNLNRILVTLKR